MNKLLLILLLGSFALFSQTKKLEKELISLSLNNEFSSFGTSFYGNDKIVFAASKSGGNLKLFVTNINTEDMSSYTLFSNVIDDKSHLTNVAFTNDKKTMYFTKSIKGKENTVNTSKNKKARIAIYKATLSADGTWGDIVSLPFNSKNYDVAHPALNKDNTMLYFTSNMPGTVGDNDIFRVQINSDGTYSQPQNLGKGVNTKGKEMFPFVSNDDILYFSSNGHQNNFGGLDIYCVTIDGASITKFRHLQKPINSKSDDFSYIINPETHIGFLSSNRKSGKGNDDIYLVKEKEVCYQRLTGIIHNNSLENVIANASIILKDGNGKKIKKTTARSNGIYNFYKLKCNKTFTVFASRVGFFESSKTATIGNKNKENTNINISLKEKKIEKTQYKTSTGRINFRLNEAVIPGSTRYELDKIIILMKYNEKLRFIVESHADSRSDDDISTKITEERIAIIRNYFISRGIDSEKIIGTAFGETKPLNKCVNNVPCTESEYRVNRRTTYKLVEKVEE